MIPFYPGVQPDSNGDSFGTRCDGDYRRRSTPLLGDCATDVFVDYPLFVQAFRAGVGPDQDHDGNGVVNANDFTIFRALWFAGQTPD
jgi:hypothetical protein